MTEERSPRQTLEAFYEAEGKYMRAKASGGEASFDGIAATLSPDVNLHQSPDLPFGGEYVGHQQYEQWAIAMSAIFDTLEVTEQEWFETETRSLSSAVSRLIHESTALRRTCRWGRSSP